MVTNTFTITLPTVTRIAGGGASRVDTLVATRRELVLAVPARFSCEDCRPEDRAAMYARLFAGEEV